MDVDPGLCGRCAWARVIASAKGSHFLRCGRSDSDPGFAKYPPLPVLACRGFDRRVDDGQAGPAQEFLT